MRANVQTELDRDTAMLESAEHGRGPRFRVWRTDEPTVVVGRSVDVGVEVDESFCAHAGVPILRRASGGRSVVVGPGTLQYAFALRYELDADLASIPGAKSFCNELLIAGLQRTGGPATRELRAERGGDLTVGTRKVGGLSMRRGRSAVLVHGTILLTADVAMIARSLRHPLREPAYRAGRSHEEFLINLGEIDDHALARTVRALLALLAI